MITSEPCRIVMLDRGTFPLETRLNGPDMPHSLHLYERTAPGEAAARIGNAHVAITNKVPITAEILDKAPDLKLVVVAATGYDVIDVKACSERGVAVCNVRDYARNTVPEHTFALILALRRNIMPYHRSVAAGRWQESGQFCYFDYPIRDLAGSTLGIFGAGAIGQAVSAIGKAFGMNVLYAARRGAHAEGIYTPFEAVLEQADIVTFHMPLRPETRNLIGPAEFARMARKPLVINTGRGGLVDENALVEALVSGQISGAGFDVTTKEPMPENHPFQSVLHRPDFILTPHVAWASREATQTVADQVFANVDNFFAGQPTNLVSG
ncbi:MAG: glycerate dehydrogenase [Pelagibacterium sp. SCN 63-23]|nr:MAG: glycerate dehydrogenase [Pelagibacterium sp. SCN 63-23]